jgi:hypothetical protein
MVLNDICKFLKYILTMLEQTRKYVKRHLKYHHKIFKYLICVEIIDNIRENRPKQSIINNLWSPFYETISAEILVCGQSLRRGPFVCL